MEKRNRRVVNIRHTPMLSFVTNTQKPGKMCETIRVAQPGYYRGTSEP